MPRWLLRSQLLCSPHLFVLASAEFHSSNILEPIGSKALPALDGSKLFFMVVLLVEQGLGGEAEPASSPGLGTSWGSLDIC